MVTLFGAKIAVNMRNSNICSKDDCERLLAFTNNSGPLFIIGTVGISLFGSSTIGVLLLITHILSALTVGIIFKFWNYKKSTHNTVYVASEKENKLQAITPYNLGDALSQSIASATSTLLMIGGFVVLFSVIISMLDNSRYNKFYFNFL